VAYDYLNTPTGERIVVETRGNTVLTSGTQVVVNFDAQEALYFDPKTETRLR
jgi:lactose/L-arabinose transport system ATP-binding protein